VRDWVNGALLFLILIWPPVDISASQANTLEKAAHYKHIRAEQVMAVISRGAAEGRWSLLYEREESVRWDRRREVWVSRDGHAYSYPEHE
jgi:hypothetical protein